jgi:hypothetical protein
MSLISEPLLDRPQPENRPQRTYLEGNAFSKLFLTWVSDLIEVRIIFWDILRWGIRQLFSRECTGI